MARKKVSGGKTPGPFVSVSAAHLHELREKAGTADEMLETARRVQAEFMRAQERMTREKEEWSKYMSEQVIRELLPSLDALDQCLATLPDEVTEGVRLVRKEILRAFEKFGVKELSPVGQPFDPKYHEAVQAVPSSEHPDNTVLEVFKSGFTIHDRVLRSAMVRVSRSEGAGKEGMGGGGGA